MSQVPSQAERGSRIADRYSSQAREYQDLWWPVLAGLAQPVLREVDRAQVNRVLDIGTGIGALLAPIESAFPEATVLGVDLSEGMLRLAPPGRHVAVMDASNLALSPKTFDLAVLAFMLFHMPDPRQGLVQARRVLRSGGSVATVTWGTEFESEATRVWAKELDDHGAQPVDAVAEPSQHELVDSPTKIAALLASAGFNSIRSWVERHERIISADHLRRLRTSYGGNKRRFDSMDTGAQSAFLSSVRNRLASLSAQDFIARADIVYSVARLP
jgi:ubiquinone/menaquinone biosynthesis C-methylase UbiE